MQTLPKINLLVFVAVWKRPDITELCFMGIDRIKKHPMYNIEALAVISEKEMIPLCNKYNIKWVMTENTPLGKKKNFGLKQASAYQFDYLLEIGSDDLITDELLDQYLEYFDQYEFFGISDICYVESSNLECRRLTTNTTTYGAGRIISRKVLESMNWNIWSDEINRGLDNNSIRNIKSNGWLYNKINPIDIPCVIDVKSDENIWKFNYFIGSGYDVNKILNRLSKQEADKLLSLKEC